MKRRQILLASLGILGLSSLAARVAAALNISVPESMAAAQGRLVIIGGAEDRTGDKLILRRFVELARRDDPQIAVLTAASAYPERVWSRYDQVLADIGVQRRVYVSLNSVEDCNNPELSALVRQSDGVLITGGNQQRLLSLIGGTPINRAIQQAYLERGACIAGTSAGAAALSQHMLTGRTMSDGIGLLRGAIVDQHFTERRRLARLVMAVAANPELIGIGVDENTALILDRGRGFEVVGAGGITIVDARRLSAPLNDADPEQLRQRPEIRVFQLPRGASYQLSNRGVAFVRGSLTLPEAYRAAPGLYELLPLLPQL